MKHDGHTAAFGWTWIARALWARKWHAILVLGLTGAGYAAGLVLPVVTQRAVDAAVAGQGLDALVWFGVFAAAAVVIEALLSSWRHGLVTDLGSFLDRRVSRAAFMRLMRVRIDAGEFKPGDVLNCFQQAGKIRAFVLATVPQTVFDVGSAIVALAMMFYYDVLIGTVIVLVTVATWLVLRRQFGAQHMAVETLHAADGRRQGVLTETVNGMAVVKSLVLETERARHWSRATDAMLKTLKAVLDQSRQLMVGMQTTARGVTAVVVGLGCYRISQGSLTVGELMAIQLLAARATVPMLSGAGLSRQYQEVNVAIEQLAKFMARPQERSSVRPQVTRLGANGGIEVSHLTLRYGANAKPAVDDVSFALPSRGVVALVGRNGSGKTSLIRCLLGLQSGFEGTITIGGHDLRQYKPRALRAGIGSVDQETILFSGTIRENVTGGRLVDDDAVREALRFAGALSFVDALPDGVDTVLPENGRSLSGGQRQRLSVARAFIRDPKFVFLDEPSAFLDAEAAVALEQELTAWGRDRLLLLVSHHLAAIRGADQILVLDEGRLVGQGDHQTLLLTTPVYASLWQDYMRSLES